MDYFVISFLEELEKIAEDPNLKLNILKKENLVSAKNFNAAKAQSASAQSQKQKGKVSSPIQQNAVQKLEEFKNA